MLKYVGKPNKKHLWTSFYHSRLYNVNSIHACLLHILNRETKRESVDRGQAQSTYTVYKEYHSVCPLVGIGTLAPPLAPASVLLSPEPEGGGHTRLRVRGWGSPNFDDLRKAYHSAFSVGSGLTLSAGEYTTNLVVRTAEGTSLLLCPCQQDS